MIYTMAAMFINWLICFDARDVFQEPTALKPEDQWITGLCFLKSQQKELTPFTAGCALFVVYSSPLRRKSFTLTLSCCHILEPLLCMSRITLIHSDHWLPRTSLSELPMGCCPLTAVCQRGRRRKCQCRRCFIRSGGIRVEEQIWIFGSQCGAVSHHVSGQSWT